jgi:hypothetical protein
LRCLECLDSGILSRMSQGCLDSEWLRMTQNDSDTLILGSTLEAVDVPDLSRSMFWTWRQDLMFPMVIVEPEFSQATVCHRQPPAPSLKWDCTLCAFNQVNLLLIL